jgi:hypothetical protein
MMRKSWWSWIFSFVVLVGLQAMADDPAPISMQVGAAIHLGDGSKTTWASSDEKIVKVYANGMAVALTPGQAVVRSARPAKDYPITVAPQGSQLVDPATLEQHADNKVFYTPDGRKCVGTVLNGFMLGNDDQKGIEGKKDHNRVLDTNPISPANPYLWEVQPHTPVVDGAGTVMGEISAHVGTDKGPVTATKINYGMTKVIKGKFFVYAFSTRINASQTLKELTNAPDLSATGTSGWIPLDWVVKKEELLEKVGVGKGKLLALPLEKDKYRITGGDPKEYYLPDGKEVSIIPNVKAGAYPSHYLRRPSGVVNIVFSVPGFSLGGQGLDSLLVSSGASFRRAVGVREFVMPTFYPKDDPREGKIADKTETFWYGAVEVRDSETIYGWVAKEALAKDTSVSD